MSQPEDSRPEALRRLDERLHAAEAAQARRTGSDTHRGLAQGYRFLGEVVGGVLGGVGLGWLVDRLAGTSPLGLVGGLLIGTGLSIFVAVKRAAGITRKEMERAGPLPSVPDDEDED